MDDFPIAFCKTPLPYEICERLSFENSTTAKYDLKQSYFSRKRQSCGGERGACNQRLKKCNFVTCPKYFDQDRSTKMAENVKKL